MSLARVEWWLRTKASEYFYLLEAALYIGVALLLCGAAIFALHHAAIVLWHGVFGDQLSNRGLLVLDQLLLVLMLVEILHTVRISIRSKELMLVVPFLVIALIASVRRVLVITLQAAKLTEAAQGTPESASAFRNAMIELGVLGILILSFAVSIYLLHRTSRREEVIPEGAGRIDSGDEGMRPPA